MAVIPLYPLNDLDVLATLKDVDPVTGRVIPLTTGPVTAFISQSNAPTAVPADGALFVNAVNTGRGKWLISFDAAVLSFTLLDPLFATTTPYLIVEMPGEIRVFAEMIYNPVRPVLVELP